MKTYEMQIDNGLLRRQLAALERLNGVEDGDVPDQKDGDFELLLGLEELVSDILYRGTSNEAIMSGAHADD